MIYTPSDIVRHFSENEVKVQPKKVRRIMRNLYPDKKNMRWELSPKEYASVLEVVGSKIREEERI